MGRLTTYDQPIEDQVIKVSEQSEMQLPIVNIVLHNWERKNTIQGVEVEEKIYK